MRAQLAYLATGNQRHRPRVGPAVTCPVCGTVAVPGARFCHNCGAALPAAATLPAAERRVVTVLFGDLSDFTSWSEDLDPERVGAVTDRVLAALAGAVKTFGGHVDKLTGDGIMAVFGAPVAHEDDAERAVRAALAMQRAVRRVLDDERGGGAPLGLRVGLNTGDVVAGVQAAHRVHGHRRHREHRRPAGRRRRRRRGLRRAPRTAAATRHVASWRRAASAAAQGQARAGRGVRAARPARRAGHPVRASATRRRSSAGRPSWAGSPAGWPRSIDRGEPRVLVFTAEAGIGKTRFAAEVERLAAGYDVGAGRYAAHAGARVLSVRCAAFGERRRLAPAGRPGPGRGRPAQRRGHRASPGRRSRSGCAGSASRLEPRATGEPRRLHTDQLLALLGYAEPPARPARGRRRRAGRPRQPGRGRRGRRRPRSPSCSARSPPRRRWWSIVDDLHDATADDRRRARRHPRPARPARCWCCCSAAPSWSAPPAR